MDDDTDQYPPGSIESSIGTLSLSQVLAALATAHLAEADGVAGSGVLVSPAMAAPGTADILLQLQSMNPVDTSWSLKPARVRPE